MALSHSTLYSKLGGKIAVTAATDLFYNRVMADDQLSPFFEGINMGMQRVHMMLFLTYAFGGADSYTGRSLRSSHKMLVEEKGLNDTHFDRVAEHLQETLKALEISPNLIQEVLDIAETTRDEVLNR